MATKTTKAKTIAERREELEKALKDLEQYETIERYLNDFKERVKRSMEGQLETSDYKGKETEQATNPDGALLWEVDGEWRHYTEAQIKEKGLEDKERKPYYNDIWVERTMTPDELKDYSEYGYKEYTALKRLYTFLDGLDVTTI